MTHSLLLIFLVLVLSTGLVLQFRHLRMLMRISLWYRSLWLLFREPELLPLAFSGLLLGALPITAFVAIWLTHPSLDMTVSAFFGKQLGGILLRSIAFLLILFMATAVAAFSSGMLACVMTLMLGGEAGFLYGTRKSLHYARLFFVENLSVLGSAAVLLKILSGRGRKGSAAFIMITIREIYLDVSAQIPGSPPPKAPGTHAHAGSRLPRQEPEADLFTGDDDYLSMLAFFIFLASTCCTFFVLTTDNPAILSLFSARGPLMDRANLMLPLYLVPALALVFAMVPLFLLDEICKIAAFLYERGDPRARPYILRHYPEEVLKRY